MKKLLLTTTTLLLMYSIVNSQTTTNTGANTGTEGTYNNYYGSFSGQLDQSSHNSFYGAFSGRFNKYINPVNPLRGYNSFFGYSSGINNKGEMNVFMGYASGGGYSDFQLKNLGIERPSIIRSTYIGTYSGRYNLGSFNVGLGYGAGLYEKGTFNVELGYYAGAGYNDTYYANLGIERPTSLRNTFVGAYSGTYKEGNFNTGSGYASGQHTLGVGNVHYGYVSGQGRSLKYYTDLGLEKPVTNYNVNMGYASGQYNEGSNNINLGYIAGYQTKGSGNVSIGHQSGYRNKEGANNVFLGFNSGLETLGSGNVFLGSYAGRTEKGSNKLYIENSSSNKPLIGGDFGTDIVTINGKLGVNVGNSTQEDDAELIVGNSTKGSILIGNDKRFSPASISSARSEGSLILGKNIYTRFLDASDNGLARVATTATNANGFSGIKLGLRGQIDFFGFRGAVTADDVANTDENIKMRINEFGNVGIGTTNPQAKLQVEGNIVTNSKIGIGVQSGDIPNEYHLAVGGKIIAEEVKVKLRTGTTWPDYVFSKNYNLPSIKTVEKHIEEKGHLENIPSAEDVSKNGINLGEMNAKLLEKIEELTLYTIQQQKEIENQKVNNTTLENRLKRLERIVEKLNNQD